MPHQSFNSIGSHIYNGYVYDNVNHEDNFHNSFEFVYVLSGLVCVNTNTVRNDLTAGDMLLIAPNIVHSVVCPPPGESKYFLGVFSRDFVSEFKNDALFYAVSRFRADKTVEKYLQQYLLYTENPEFYMLKSCLYAICAQCVKHGDTSAQEPILSNRNFIREVNTYIFDHLTGEVTQKDLAAALGYERHYFSSLFHRVFQMGFKQYVNIYRFNNACQLLTTTDMSILNIALECGFSNVRSFNRVFKEMSGETPSLYKKHQLTNTRLPERAHPVGKTLRKPSKS